MEIDLRSRRAPALQAHGRQLWSCRTAERARLAGLALASVTALAMLSLPAGLCAQRIQAPIAHAGTSTGPAPVSVIASVVGP